MSVRGRFLSVLDDSLHDLNRAAAAEICCSEITLPLPPDTGAEGCQVFFSDRARRLRLKITAEGLVRMTVPNFTPEPLILDFLHAQIPWIRRTIPSIRRRASVMRAYDFHFPDTVDIPLLGKIFRTVYVWRDKCWTAARFDLEKNELIFSGSVLDQRAILTAFSALLKRESEQLFPPVLAKLSEQTGIPFRQCSIRIQSSRWGSCTSAGHISLNAKMLFFDPSLLEYVMIHELCHLREMNHSSAFWNEVAQFIPDYINRRRTLNARSAALPGIFRYLK